MPDPKSPGGPERPTGYFLRVRAAVRRIPKGKVATYGQVAEAAGFPGTARQVAWALRNASGLPWHRVVGAGGKILLAGEPGAEQRMRLAAEGVGFHGDRVRLAGHAFVFSRRRTDPGAKGLR
jgi:methylated-DNA-protein-cysteine methyltransferase related protein